MGNCIRYRAHQSQYKERWIRDQNVFYKIKFSSCNLCNNIIPSPFLSNPISAKSVSQDGKLIALAQDDDIIIYDAKTLQQIGEKISGYVVTSIAFSYDGSLLISGCFDGTIRIWDTYSRKQIGNPYLRFLKHITTVLLSKDSQYIAAQNCIGDLEIWKFNEAQVSLIQKSNLSSFHFASNSRYILFSDSCKQMNLQNIETRKKSCYNIMGFNFGFVKFLLISKTFAFVHDDRIKICDYQRNKLITQYQGHIHQAVEYSHYREIILPRPEFQQISFLDIIQRKQQYVQDKDNCQVCLMRNPSRVYYNIVNPIE